MYLKQQLSDRQLQEVHHIIQSYEYYCGCMVTPNVSSLSSEVFTRLKLTCSSPIEWACYGATIRTMRKNLCLCCGVNKGVINQELKKCYKTVLPICEECKKFKEPMKQMPHKTAEAQRTINKMFPKKKMVTPACVFFNLLHYVSILVLFFM